MIITQFATIEPKWYPLSAVDGRRPDVPRPWNPGQNLKGQNLVKRKNNFTYSLKPSNIFWFFLSTRSSFPSFVGPFLATEVIFKLSKHSENKNFFVPWLYLNRMFFSFECYKVSHLSRELPLFNIIN